MAEDPSLAKYMYLGNGRDPEKASLESEGGYYWQVRTKSIRGVSQQQKQTNKEGLERIFAPHCVEPLRAVLAPTLSIPSSSIPCRFPPSPLFFG